MSPQILDGYISIDEAARQLNCSIRTIQRLAQKRQIAFTKLGIRLLVDVESTREMIKARLVKPVSERRGRK